MDQVTIYTPYTSFNAWYERVTEENEEGKIEYKFEYLPTALDPEFLDGTIDYTMSHREPSLTSRRIFKRMRPVNLNWLGRW